MTTLKFTAWDKINKRWLNVSSLSLTKDGTVNGVWELRDGENELYGLHQVEIVRFTGLHDKKGKEIYEGDIVDWGDGSNGKWRRRCVINWTPAYYTLEGHYYDVDNPAKRAQINCVFDGFIYGRDVELEIIGNIYENPELLNQ